jgi:recombination protein RecA
MAKKETVKISDVISSIEKRFGKEAISGTKTECEFVSSGSINLDIALGGGYAKGRIIELMGWESSGKSSLAFHLASEIQKLNKVVAYIDMEHAVDLDYINNLDVKTDGNLWYMSQPENGEEGIEIAREFLKSEEVGLIVVDSVTALIPKAVLLGEAGDSKMGLQARLMSSMLPTMIAQARKTGCIVLFINQYREKIGVMFGSPTTTTGGNALKFYASQRLEVARAGQEKDKDGEVTANKTRVKVVKNKVAPPFRKAEFDIVFGKGIDKVQEIIDIAIEMEIIKKAGSWYSYGEVKLGQGAESVKTIMEDNPELFDEINNKIRKNLK